MDGTKIIKKLLLEKDINTVELAKRLGCGTANLYNKYKRNNFSLNELEEIAAAVGCNLEITFSDKQGNQSFSINQSVSYVLIVLSGSGGSGCLFLLFSVDGYIIH